MDCDHKGMRCETLWMMVPVDVPLPITPKYILQNPEHVFYSRASARTAKNLCYMPSLQKVVPVLMICVEKK